MAKFCSNCGKELEPGATACPECGAEVPQQQTAQQTQPDAPDGAEKKETPDAAEPAAVQPEASKTPDASDTAPQLTLTPNVYGQQSQQPQPFAQQQPAQQQPQSFGQPQQSGQPQSFAQPPKPEQQQFRQPQQPAQQPPQGQPIQNMQNPTPVIVPNAPVQPMPVPNEFDPEEAKRVKPLSTAAYFWLMFLFAVPLIGFIVCLIMAFAAKNENRKHFARSILIWILVGLIISGVIALVGAIFGQTLLQNLGVSDVSGIPDLLQQLFGGM